MLPWYPGVPRQHRSRPQGAWTAAYAAVTYRCPSFGKNVTKYISDPWRPEVCQRRAGIYSEEPGLSHIRARYRQSPHLEVGCGQIEGGYLNRLW